MYSIGIKNSNWILISDGDNVFTAEKDVRWSGNVGSGSDLYNQRNRFSQLPLDQEQLHEYCQSNGLILRGESGAIESAVEKGKKIIGPASIAGGLGALMGGPIGAALGIGVAGYLFSSSDFELKEIISVFARAKSLCSEWSEFDLREIKKKAEEAVAYEKLARNSWNKYYRLRKLNLIDTLEGVEFEMVVRDIYRSKGYSVSLTSKTGDYGVDVIAEGNGTKIAIQAKRYTQSVGVGAVQEVVSGSFYYKADKAVVITNSFFTANAKKMADKLGVELIDRSKLTILWSEAFPENFIPFFDLSKYEEQKKEIIGTLIRVKGEKSSKSKKRYFR